MRYCFRFGRFRPNPRTKHISVPPQHMTKSYISDFNMISQHYRYKYTHLIQSAYNCLNTLHQRKIHVWVHTPSVSFYSAYKVWSKSNLIKFDQIYTKKYQHLQHQSYTI